jgi:transposase
MTPREQRGLVIAALHKLNKTNDGWIVPSQSKAETTYRVSVERQTCTCPDCTESGYKCKHLYAVEFTIRRETDRDGNFIETKTMTFVEKKTYTQNWPIYEKAQHEEKARFQILLADLCRGCVDSAHEGVGRKPVPLADRLFATCFKVYSTVSSRRFNCDLEDAHERGYISRPIHPSKLRAFMADEEMTPYLKSLLVRSSLPLKALETEFAVDSTGFSTSKFVRWYDEKYGVTRSGHDWVKVHIACGVKTGVTTAAAIYGRDTNDCPILPELIDKTKENFTIREVSADKGYLSVENVEKIFAAGGIPFIHPKDNTTGGVGGLFEKMFHFYQYKQDEFMQRYHKRSNVESVFSAVKRKFSDHVRSRTPTAMVNESFAKLLCNNLCCVIMSQAELGIEAEFWQNDKANEWDDQPAILTLRK